MDAQRTDGEWSVEKVLQLIIINCRSWRGEGMKVMEMEKKMVKLVVQSKLGMLSKGLTCRCSHRCSRNYASLMNKRVIRKSSLSLTCGS